MHKYFSILTFILSNVSKTPPPYPACDAICFPPLVPSSGCTGDGMALPSRAQASESQDFSALVHLRQVGFKKPLC